MRRAAVRMLVYFLTGLGFVAAADAAPVTIRLMRTSPLYNEDPPGAPLPLARTQYDAGDVLFQGTKIGEYLSVKDVHSGTLNVAAVTITLFFPTAGTDLPGSITLQGAHTFDSGRQSGSISASSFAGIQDVQWVGSTVTGLYTLQIP